VANIILQIVLVARSILYAIISKTMTLSLVQIILSLFLGALILIQQSEGSLGSAFGGGDSAGNTHTRRGPELIIFRITILLAILFVVFALINLLY